MTKINFHFKYRAQGVEHNYEKGTMACCLIWPKCLHKFKDKFRQGILECPSSLSKKEQNSHVKQAALQMPSYFLELEYEQGQTNLSPAQVKKVEAMLKKIVYPDEYKIYASFGSSGEKNQVVNLAPVFKRAEDIKSRYSKRVKEVKVAYLKNQKPDCVYIRLLA